MYGRCTAGVRSVRRRLSLGVRTVYAVGCPWLRATRPGGEPHSVTQSRPAHWPALLHYSHVALLVLVATMYQTVLFLVRGVTEDQGTEAAVLLQAGQPTALHRQEQPEVCSCLLHYSRWLSLVVVQPTPSYSGWVGYLLVIYVPSLYSSGRACPIAGKRGHRQPLAVALPLLPYSHGTHPLVVELRRGRGHP